MAAADFEIERLRLQAAGSLPAHCFDDFQRLSRTLLHGPAFQWLLVDAPHELLRKQVMAALDGVLHAAGLQINRLPLGRRIADVATLEKRLLKNAGKAAVVHVIGSQGWFDAARWDAFNVRRERIAAEVRARLVFWLDAEAIALASHGAPDLWAWRGGVYAFTPLRSTGLLRTDTVGGDAPFVPHRDGPDVRSMSERRRRIADIRAWLDSHGSAADDLIVAPLEELGRLLHAVGDYDAALAHWRERELPLHRLRGDDRRVAVTQGKIADVLQVRGQLDEVLRIRREEQLPVYERLGDARSVALTQGGIADVLEARGQSDEALRIRREEELPVYERLGDERERAVTQAKIADVLEARGQLDEALRIHREELVPVFERLGDVRARAVTQGRIADVLEARGELNEVLRIRREEQLPVFERLGDVRERALTQARIADVLEARGQLGEALRIRREELLPVFESLGDVRSMALTHGGIADVLEAWGQWDEALRIRQEEELPVYERLGDVRARAVVRWKIALQLLGRAESASLAEARQLLEAAYADLSRMGLPEAQVLAEQMRERGLTVVPST
ncbi:MAG: hypothetical protein AW09_004593 [Candidatus Accumulibacter phosphatis]|jgi:tetratricopeptide (TPR) repeat protein|uniref:Tetratricopeptide repeat protein n=1 Tax=Candidatus Accumulibacter phosphatis TaxID=327160 RepID=A0A084Y6H3_9PROT|nr:hypothetical protein [Candidatus Accumulibacter sp. ACC005]KFB70317.1 MAG: hypothetical protein AW09_004593 [Candidatus Accumulibacter phosphatis]